jgi:transcriptional regulator with XRE-family HTH domain
MKGWTITELAERSGVGRGHVSRIEAGKYAVSLDILQAIAEALGMTVDLIDERLTDLAPLKVLSNS